MDLGLDVKEQGKFTVLSVHGEVDVYTAPKFRERLIEHAKQLGGNAVLGARFDSSDVGQGLSEIVAYGTAAVIRAD